MKKKFEQHSAIVNNKDNIKKKKKRSFNY
jgi:hypothetical protein